MYYEHSFGAGDGGFGTARPAGSTGLPPRPHNRPRQARCVGDPPRQDGRAKRSPASLPARCRLGFCCVLIVTAVSAAGFRTAQACQIPVFRYALERWPADYYEVMVVHRGALKQADEQLVETLTAAPDDPDHPANFTVTRVDLDESPSAPDAPTATDQELATDQVRATDQELLTEFADLDSPQLVLRFPPRGPSPVAAWSGPLTAENVTRLIDSPLRRKISDRIVSGDSAVWVFIPGGDEKADAEAESTLGKELARLEELLELPEQDLTDGLPPAAASGELRVAFSVVRLDRNDPAEQIFLSALLRTEPDLETFNEPIAIPVFGRGRTYYALVGKGINRSTIEESCQFLCGACSCQVKALNPGVDMLFAVDWNARIEESAMSDEPLPELTGVGGLEIIDVAALDPSRAESAPQPAADAGPAQSTAAEATAQPAAGAAAELESSAAPADDPAGAAEPAAVAVPDRTVVAGADVANPASDFGRNVLAWLIGGVVVAGTVIFASSLWMRGGQG